VPITKDYLSYVLEQLALVRGVTTRRMFGAVGLYSDELFFAVIDDDTLFFKTGEENREDYESRGMRRFSPFPDAPPGSGFGYHEVPADVLEDGEQLAAWARKSVEVALGRAAARKPRVKKTRAKKAPQKRKRRPKAAFK
jgi:DNA transformation protein